MQRWEAFDTALDGLNRAVAESGPDPSVREALKTLRAAAQKLDSSLPPVPCKTGEAEKPEAVELPAWTRRGVGRCPDMPEFDVSPRSFCAVGVSSNIITPSLARETASSLARAGLASLATSTVSQLEAKSSKRSTRSVSTLGAVRLEGVEIVLYFTPKGSNDNYALAMISAENLAAATAGAALGDSASPDGLAAYERRVLDRLKRQQ